MSVTLNPLPMQVVRPQYKGQKVMSPLKALRTNEIRKNMSLVVCNMADNLYNVYKINGQLDNAQYKTLLQMYFDYVLRDRNDNLITISDR